MNSTGALSSYLFDFRRSIVLATVKMDRRNRPKMDSVALGVFPSLCRTALAKPIVN